MTEDDIERLHRRSTLTVASGRVTLVDDTGQVQRLQARLSQRELLDKLPRVGEYGLQSNPPAGTDLVVVFLGGDRSNGVVVGTNSQTYRVRNLASGEVALSDDKGLSIYLSAEGIKVDGGGKPVDVSNATSVTVTADDIVLNGRVTVNGPTVLNGPITQTAGAGGDTTATLLGPLNVAGEVTTAGINLTVHNHGGIVRGSARTDGPLTG